GALAVGVDDLPPGRGLLTHHHAARPALGGADRLGGRGGRRGALVLVLGACRGRAQGERAGEGGEPPQEARWRGAGRGRRRRGGAVGGRRRWGCREMQRVTFSNVRMRLLDATGARIHRVQRPMVAAEPGGATPTPRPSRTSGPAKRCIISSRNNPAGFTVTSV